MAVQRFQGTDKYVATDDLRIAVNASIALERPLLLKGEPGTGKTVLAKHVADTIPHSELVLIPNVGHVPHIQVPDVFQRELLKFLA